MKPQICIAFAAVLALPLVSACSHETTEAASKTLESAGKDISANYAELKKSTEKQLAKVDDELADLKVKAQSLTGEAREEADELAVKIRAKKDEVAKAVADLDVPGKTEQAWETSKKKVDGLMKDLTQLVEQAKDKVK